MKTKIKKLSLYKKSLILFSLILLIIILWCLIYVSKTLIRYEKSDVNVYINDLLLDMQKSAKKKKIDKYLSYNGQTSNLENDANYKEGYKELLTRKKLSYKNSEIENQYDLYADDILFATVTLEKVRDEKRLGLLNYPVWKTKEIKAHNEKGIYVLDFYIDSNVNLSINNNPITDDYLVDKEVVNEYQEVSKLVNTPLVKHYQITNLTKEPYIKLVNQKGENVNFEYRDGKYYANDYFKTDDNNEAFKHLEHADFDALELAKKWSLFLSKDLMGTRYGLYQLTPNLQEGTAIYKRAYNWATGIDITFTSQHVLEKERFTNCKLSNFTVYNANAFSVEVYLEKNMRVSGKKIKDILHEMFYFVYEDGAYRLVYAQTMGKE